MSGPVRSDAEILARYEAIKGEDFLGFRAEALLPALSAEAAQGSGLFKEGVDWSDWKPVTHEEVAEQLRSYMEFAWGKVRDHRGISAGRSIEKITEWAWLLGRDDVMAAMDGADYAQYGAPKLAAACRLLDLPIPEGEDLANMIAGQPCERGCDMGCGT